MLTTTDAARWTNVVALYAKVEHELAKALQRRHGLGLSDYRALTQLDAADAGEMRMQELAESIGLNQSSVSRLAARLEDAELTTRDLCEGDRRGVYSVITEEGRRVRAAAAPTYEATLATALERAATDPDLAGLVATLRD